MLMQRLSSGVLILLAFATACSPASGGQGGGAPEQGEARAPKTLTIGLLREPATIDGFTGQGGSRGGAGEAGALMHNLLTVQDPYEVDQPQLAVELPSADRDTWRVNADGSMDITWKLQPNARWHDGTPFTADDVMFSLMLHKDPDLAHAFTGQARTMQSATAPDPHTVVVHWSRIDVRALDTRVLSPVAKHLLEGLYTSDKEGFINSPRFTTEFIGLGPYRMVRWEPAAHIELARFDGYFRGPPPLDRVMVQFIRDPNILLANALAGTVDLVPPPSIEIEQAAELRRRWEGTGNTVRVEPIPRIQYMELQMGQELARPRNGFAQLAVRQGLYHALDRATLAEVMTLGLGPPADSWYRPDEPIRRELESAIPKFPYDSARARQLLTQAGWTPGNDGTLVHGPSGERFELEVWMNPQSSEKALAIIADQWKAIGVDPKPSVIPPARAEDREYTAQHPGPLLTGSFLDQLLVRYDSRDMASTVNRWSGRNRAGYVNLRADQLLDELATTVDPRARLPLMREQVQTMMDDIALVPLYWEPRPLVALRSVRADIHPHNVGWNAETWNKE